MAKEPVPLTIYIVESKPYISAIELFHIILPYSNTYYTRWVKMNITDQPQDLPTKGLDYLVFNDVHGIKRKERIRGGKKRIDYLLSPLFAVQLCYQTKTTPAKGIKDFLYKIVK